jgi:tetrapyrrole methylase family protein/MazG family protein
MDVKNTVKELLDKKTYNFEDLVTVMKVLRSEEGCMWDREQTHESIRNNFIEETYEVIEAIDTSDTKLLREELGDVLLQIVFHAEMESEKGVFNVDDVANDVCVKLIHRHPHIFSDVSVSSTADILANWETIKAKEKSRTTLTSKLRSIPPMLPALMRAEKVGKKASMLDFPTVEDVLAKLDEEIAELKAAVREGGNSEVNEELGDVLLTLSSLSRKLDVDAERALNASTTKFIDRFEKVENECEKRGINMKESDIAVLDAIYNEVK